MDWTYLLIVTVKVIVVVVGLLGGFAYMTLVERKVIGRFQLRIGPNQAGPYALLQPIADAIKAVFKEEIIVANADKVVYVLAPAISVGFALAAFAVIPFGPVIHLFGRAVPLQIADVNIGLLYILAMGGLGTYGLVLGGWSSGSNYSLLGALRTTAQIVSYELPMGIFVASVVLGAGTLRLSGFVEAARPWYMWIWLWLSFPFYFTVMLAETNRSPFDLPETENELISGFQTEYGGIKFALFFMAEYINMITASAVMTTVFFGGWRGPFVAQWPLLGVLYFTIKTFILLLVFLWVRASFPRLRYDQLMSFSWKLMLPISLIYLAITACLVVLV